MASLVERPKDLFFLNNNNNSKDFSFIALLSYKIQIWKIWLKNKNVFKTLVVGLIEIYKRNIFFNKIILNKIYDENIIHVITER